MYCKAVSSLVFNLVFSLGSSLRIYRINSQNTMRYGAQNETYIED